MNYGEFGGQYVPQELKKRLEEIEKEFEKAKEDKEFREKYLYYFRKSCRKSNEKYKF